MLIFSPILREAGPGPAGCMSRRPSGEGRMRPERPRIDRRTPMGLPIATPAETHGDADCAAASLNRPVILLGQRPCDAGAMFPPASASAASRRLAIAWQ